MLEMYREIGRKSNKHEGKALRADCYLGYRGKTLKLLKIRTTIVISLTNKVKMMFLLKLWQKPCILCSIIQLAL